MRSYRLPLVFLASLALPATAAAHVTIAPPFVDAGVRTTVRFQMPNERPPHATVALTVTAPPGVSVDGAEAPPGWKVTTSGSTATWQGGRITGRRIVGFPLEVTARVRAGSYAFDARQRYDDGAKVDWKVALSVLPATGAQAPRQHLWGGLAAAGVGLLVVVASILGLRRLRRTTLQER